jgi:protein CpxP
MKNFALILMMVIAVTFTANTQEKTAQKKRQNRRQFTVEQNTELAVKRMTLALDLNEKQQNQIKPLLMTQAAQRKTAMEKMKKARENKQKPSEEELFTMRSQQLGNQIAMKKSMKEILTKEQFEEFEKMVKMRKTKGKKMLEKKGKK